MNYTPLPNQLVNDSFSARPQAPIDDNGHKPLIIGSIIILAIVILVLVFSIFRPKNVAPPATDVVPTQAQNDTEDDIDVIEEMPVPTEDIILLESPDSSTPEAGLSPTIVPNDSKMVKVDSDNMTKSPTTPIGGSTSLPTLPSAGISMSIITIVFLSGFVILVGFVL